MKIIKKLQLFLFVFPSFFSLHNAQALTVGTPTYGGYACGACEMAHRSVVVINSDKSSYSPGETMILSGTITTEVADFGMGVVSPSDTLAVGGWYGTTFDTTSPASYISFGGGETTVPSTYFGSGSIVIPSLSAGSHYLRIRSTARTRYVPQGYNPQEITYGNLTFTVAAAPQPTVNLFFSQALEKLKKLFV